MATDLFTVHDYRKWGWLVKSWATGRPIPGTTGSAPTPPTTLAELKAQCDAIGLRIDLPSYLEQIRVLPGAKNTLTIRLPAKELVLSVEQDLATSPGYRLPQFYEDLFGHPMPEITPERKLDLQAERIGDYAVGMCA